MGPHGSENFNTLLLYITAESFQTFPEIYPMVLTKLRLGFLNFENWNLNEFYSFSLTWDPMGVKISKYYYAYKSQPKAFKLVRNFLPNGPHKTTFGIFEILKIEILMNFIRFR